MRNNFPILGISDGMGHVNTFCSRKALLYYALIQLEGFVIASVPSHHTMYICTVTLCIEMINIECSFLQAFRQSVADTKRFRVWPDG